MIISNQTQVDEVIQTVKLNMQKTRDSLLRTVLENDTSEALLTIKFAPIGVDPITGEASNFIEVLNQSFSDLVALYAVSQLLNSYPEKEFQLNLGAKSGYDIVAIDGSVIAECFSATSVDSNQKLKHDAEKLQKLPANIEKYIFFYVHNDDEDKIARKRELFPDIKLIRLIEFS